MGNVQKQIERNVGKEVAKIILCSLAEGLVCSLIAPNKYAMGKLLVPLEWQKIKQKSLKQAIRRLQKQRFVMMGQSDGKTVIKITELGRTRVLKYKLGELKIKKPRKWDRKWRVVVFDIPEAKKRARDTLRKKLKELGMLQIQKSVFVHPYPCRDEIDFVKEMYEIGPHVYCFEADLYDVEERVLKYFQHLIV